MHEMHIIINYIERQGEIKRAPVIFFGEKWPLTSSVLEEGRLIVHEEELLCRDFRNIMVYIVLYIGPLNLVIIIYIV